METGRTSAVTVCRCPGTPHPEGDIIELRPTLGLEAGLEAETLMLRAVRTAVPGPYGPVLDTEWLVDQWLPVFVRAGAYAWNRVDENGEPVPFDIEAIMGDYRVARAVGDAAADLYSEEVIDPLLQRLGLNSQPGPTEPSTSHPSKPRRRSSGSSSRPTSVPMQ